MGRSLTHKLIDAHLAAGKAVAGEEIGLAIDQVLLTDTNGIQSWLQFEALGFQRVMPARAVTYIDHNVYQVDSRNTDDHRYLQSVARKYGSLFSKPGNGICHQVHLESFSVPGQTLLGTDSHTPLCGAAGMLAIGAGGLDVAVAMGGGPYSFTMPAVVRVWLTGELGPWVTAKDVILEMLRRFSVRGGAGKVFEYAGPGVASLSLPQRMTIANMGAELGLTTSLFPSDAVTRDYFRRLHRKHAWTPQAADEDAEYDARLELDLSAITPLVALPGSPDRVVPVEEVEGTQVEQVMVGARAAALLPGSFAASGAGLVMPDGQGEVIRGPNIKSVPLGEPVAETLEAPVLLKLGDKVSTDDISPAGAAILVFRSNIPAIAEFCFKYLDPEFVLRAKAAGRGILVAGEHYGQGSSREVAAIGPMYLGVRVVLARSFARIHRANLINWGVVPLTFDDPAAHDGIERDDPLRLPGLRSALAAGARVSVVNGRTG